MSTDRWFFGGVAVLTIVINAAGFMPALIDPVSRTVPLPLTPLIVAHAIVADTWLVLFLTQTTLVAAHRTAAHRRLGIAGVGVAVAFVVVSWIAQVEFARRGYDLSGDLVARGTRIDPVAGFGGLNQTFYSGHSWHWRSGIDNGRTCTSGLWRWRCSVP